MRYEKTLCRSVQTADKQQRNCEKTNRKENEPIGRTIKRVLRKHSLQKRNKENRRDILTFHHNAKDQWSNERIHNR